jgi:hypothetical protein
MCLPHLSSDLGEIWYERPQRTAVMHFFMKIGAGKVILLLRAKLNYIFARTVKRRDV